MEACYRLDKQTHGQEELLEETVKKSKVPETHIEVLAIIWKIRLRKSRRSNRSSWWLSGTLLGESENSFH